MAAGRAKALARVCHGWYPWDVNLRRMTLDGIMQCLKRCRRLSFVRWVALWPFFWLLSLLLVGGGARLWLIHRFGTPLPFWDQWEEARVVYLPYLDGRLSLGALFSPHNEHRIFFTRIYGLGLLLLNGGQWDNQVQMVANALLYAATLGGLGWLLSRALGPRYWPLIGLILMVVLAAPFGWENTLAGFQSSFYFMALFSLLTLRLLGFHRAGSWWWIGGVLAAISSVFTVAAGFLGAAAVVGLAGLRIARQPARWRELWRALWPSIAVASMVVMLGLILRVDVPHTRELMAQSAGQFFLSLGKYLAWPWIVVPPFAVANMAPLVLLAWVYLRERNEAMPAEEMALALGGWAVLQALAGAYGRGAQEYPQWRYMDSICFLLVANVLSAGLLLGRHLVTSRRMRLWRGAFLLWGAATIAGLGLLTARAWQVDIRERRLFHTAQMQYARAFMATGDPHVFNGLPLPYLPIFQGDRLAPPLRYPAEWIVNYLRNPRVRAMLPSCVRDPLAMLPDAVSGFATNGPSSARLTIPGEVVWSSDAGRGSSSKGRFESQPMAPGNFPYLEFRVAGDLGTPGLSLSLVELSSGKATPIRPRDVPGRKWVNCRVPVPHGPFKVVAVDESSMGWFAFQAPREVGRLSYLAGQILSLGKYLVFAGLGLFLFNLLALLAYGRGGGDIAPRSFGAVEPNQVGPMARLNGSS